MHPESIRVQHGEGMGDHRKLRWLRHIASAARKQGKMTAHIEPRLLPIFSVCLPTSVPQSLYSCPEMFPNVVLASRFQCLVIGLCLVHICAMCQSRPHTSSTVTVGMKEHTASLNVTLEVAHVLLLTPHCLRELLEGDLILRMECEF